MRSIFITLLIILLELTGSAQEATLDSWYYIDNNGDTAIFADYQYDVNDELEHIYYSDMYHSQYGTKTYRNDTLIKFQYYQIEEYYSYLNDTVLVRKYYISGDSSYTYYTVNDYNAVIKYALYDFIWYEGNLMETLFNSQSYSSREYNFNYINPWFEESKYFRYYGFIGPECGSYNMISKLIFSTGGEYTFEVIESIGVFPTFIQHTIETSGEVYEYHFQYHNIVSGIPEVQSEPHNILTVDYYDLMGRKIEKPRQGFYIERKITDKGVISAKHYIQ